MHNCASDCNMLCLVIVLTCHSTVFNAVCLCLVIVLTCYGISRLLQCASGA
jgi:hypothetical protein